MAYFYVFIGGGLGAVCRYGVTTTVGMLLGGMFPWGTLVVNLVGSLLIGLVLGALLPLAKSLQLLPESLRLLLTVGFLGGFTTFSSFSMETLTLLRGDSFFLAAVNVVGSIVLGLAAAYIGYQLAMVFQR